MSDLDIIIQCKKGKRQAQQRLYDKYADRFYRVAFRYLKHQEDAEDIVMMSFVKIFSAIVSFDWRTENSLEAWMRRIVINESLMWLRKHHNLSLTERLDGDKPEHDIETLGDVDGEYLYQLILELPVGYRTVFNLYVVEGYDHAEIAQELQISESTSRSQLCKARELLKRKIAKEGIQYGT